jgi:16S rRNA (guanine527-N7)-methyltransferase
MNLIAKYFSSLNNDQLQKLESLYSVYADWNSKINLISRKDMNYFYLRHVLHSLSIAKFYQFKSGSRVMDVGTGGGFPGIPLSIFFPDVNFHLVDSIGKKINVIKVIREELNLKNVNTHNERMEKIDLTVDFVVCRAVAPMETLVDWVGDNVSKKHRHEMKNGFICLKGGDLSEELKKFKSKQIIGLSTYFQETFFKTKNLVYIPLN